eukprot:6189550-Pleurochrysis_carterae.AAC.1
MRRYSIAALACCKSGTHWKERTARRRRQHRSKSEFCSSVRIPVRKKSCQEDSYCLTMMIAAAQNAATPAEAAANTCTLHGRNDSSVEAAVLKLHLSGKILCKQVSATAGTAVFQTASCTKH